MLTKPERLLGYLVFLVTVLTIFAAPAPSEAARYHVKTTGTRFSGPSNPGDWSDANCYPAIHTACNAIAADDSLLLSRETHVLGQSVDLPRFLGNPEFDGNTSDLKVMVTTLGRMYVRGTFAHFFMRGIAFEGDGENSRYAALELDNSGGLLDQAFIHNCDFTNLEGSDQGAILPGGGSAIRADGDGGQAYLDIRECRFWDNRCRGGGGAVFFGANYEIYITDSEFINNLSDNGFQFFDGHGGAICLTSYNARSQLTLVDCLIDGNAAKGPGGAISIEDGSLIMIDTQLLNSRSALGGATNWAAGAGLLMRGVNSHDQSLRLEMYGCDVIGNLGDLSVGTGAGDGGGVLVKGISGQMVDVYVARCSFEDNYNAQGAGLYIGRFTNGEVEQCSFRNNSAYFNGGGSYKGGAFAENLGETVTYNYCEFMGNRAGYNLDGTEAGTGRGGAFCTRLYPRAFFYNCTFLDNHTGPTAGQSDAIYMWRDGGQFDDDLKRLRLYNCLFYGLAGNDIQINTQENAFQLVTNCAFEEGQFLCPGVEPVATVVLAGNPCTSLTDAVLLNGSACIDAALPLGFWEDFAGDPVPRGNGPDIGAREYQPLSPIADGLDIPLASLHSPRVWPNPFNPKVQISFNLEAGMFVDVKIYDIRGALVRQLYSGTLSSGVQQLSWDGRDVTGQAVASGPYMSVITGGGQQVATRMTLIR